MDFYCPKLKLVIEIDGIQHYESKNVEYDDKRTKFLEALGLKVIRFDNSDVKRNCRTVTSDIACCCEEIAQQLGVHVSFPKDI